MLEYTRQDLIMEYLREHRTATVAHLAKRFFASEATVRRDLTQLEQKGMLKRLHGGAVLLDDIQSELPLYMREQQHVPEKKAIAAKAASYLQDGQVIFLDASSTVFFLIPHLEKYRNLTVITNGVKTAEGLSRLPHRIFSTGGLLLHNSYAYVGPYAEEFIRSFNADVFFFSGRGILESGQITDASAEETHIRKVMLQQSRTHVFLCDRSKLGGSYTYNLGNANDMDDWIMNDEPGQA